MCKILPWYFCVLLRPEGRKCLSALKLCTTHQSYQPSVNSTPSTNVTTLKKTMEVTTHASFLFPSASNSCHLYGKMVKPASPLPTSTIIVLNCVGIVPVATKLISFSHFYILIDNSKWQSEILLRTNWIKSRQLWWRTFHFLHFSNFIVVYLLPQVSLLFGSVC